MNGICIFVQLSWQSSDLWERREMHFEKHLAVTLLLLCNQIIYCWMNDPIRMCSFLCIIRGHQHWNQMRPRGGWPSRGRHWLRYHQEWQRYLYCQIHSARSRPVHHYGAVCRPGKNTVFTAEGTLIWEFFFKIAFTFGCDRKFPSVRSKLKSILPTMLPKWEQRAPDSIRQVRHLRFY